MWRNEERFRRTEEKIGNHSCREPAFTHGRIGAVFDANRAEIVNEDRRAQYGQVSELPGRVKPQTRKQDEASTEMSRRGQPESRKHDNEECDERDRDKGHERQRGVEEWAER